MNRNDRISGNSTMSPLAKNVGPGLRKAPATHVDYETRSGKLGSRGEELPVEAVLSANRHERIKDESINFKETDLKNAVLPDLFLQATADGFETWVRHIFLSFWPLSDSTSP